jgi:hypothetical protein
MHSGNIIAKIYRFPQQRELHALLPFDHFRVSVDQISGSFDLLDFYYRASQESSLVLSQCHEVSVEATGGESEEQDWEII